MKLLFQASKRTAELVIGRCGYCPKRGSIADYLHHMGSYDIYPLSGTPNKIQSYWTLVKPFDRLTWTSVAASIMATTLTLVMIDRLSASWKPWKSRIEPHLSTQNIDQVKVTIINKNMFIDAFIVLGYLGLSWTPEFNQGARNHIAKAKLIMLAEWMLLAFLLSLSYRSVLLATIVSPEYEKPIDTIQDMLESDKSIFVLNGTTLAKLLRKDPKPDVRSLANKVTYYEVNKNGTHPQWVLEKYHITNVSSIVTTYEMFYFQEFAK